MHLLHMHRLKGSPSDNIFSDAGDTPVAEHGIPEVQSIPHPSALHIPTAASKSIASALEQATLSRPAAADDKAAEVGERDEAVEEERRQRLRQVIEGYAALTVDKHGQDCNKLGLAVCWQAVGAVRGSVRMLASCSRSSAGCKSSDKILEPDAFAFMTQQVQLQLLSQPFSSSVAC